MPDIRFYSLNEFAGWAAAPTAVARLIELHRPRRILEVGSGANPTLDPSFIEAHGIEYTVNDVSEEELAKANVAYRKLLMDVSRDEPAPTLLEGFDFIFSRMVNEHVLDGRRYYRNLKRMLSPGGVTAHWFSTLYSLPFLVNKIIPDWLSGRMLRVFSQRDAHRQGKFKAYYSWSRGPTQGMIRRFEALGFEVLHYHGYFGHLYYQRPIPWLHRLEQWKAELLLRHPIPALTSYAHVVLRAVHRAEQAAI